MSQFSTPDLAKPNTPFLGGMGSVFFRGRHTVTLSFLIAVLLFFLPFAEFKCVNETITHNTGIGIVLGQSWKAATSASYEKEVTEKLMMLKDKEKDILKDPPNIFAIVAFVAGLAGIAFAFTRVQ